MGVSDDEQVPGIIGIKVEHYESCISPTDYHVTDVIVLGSYVAKYTPVSLGVDEFHTPGSP